MSPNLQETQSGDVPSSWRTLPKKCQLVILALCRVVDFMQVASFQTVCYYQLKSFDPALSEETISWQTGLASSSFFGAQIFTTMIWGRIADAEWGGRKRVLLIGLLGPGISCIGLAFSKSFLAVVLSRLLAGASNGTVGTIRTMVSENIKERKHQSRGFLLLPASFMVASILGPVCGSWLADPVSIYPSLFGINSILRGSAGVEWLVQYPYALPALFSALCMFFIALIVFLFIEETSESRLNRQDMGLRICSFILRPLRRSDVESCHQYYPVLTEDIEIETYDTESSGTKSRPITPEPHQPLQFRQIWTLNVITVLIAQCLFDLHLGAFGCLLPLFLSTPRSNLSKTWTFISNGGLGMTPRSAGFALSILGLVGIVPQLFIYPYLNKRLGTVRCLRIFSTLFPISYALTPLLALITTNDSISLWISISVVLMIQTMGRVFVMPAVIVLLNNCAPDPSVLATVHGMGQTASALFRTLGTICGGYLFGVASDYGVAAAIWWVIALVAILNYLASLFVWERPAG